MTQVIQISQTKFDELLNRIIRLEAMVAKLLARSNIANVPLMDKETEKMIEQGLEDYKHGRYTTVKTQKELEAYLDSL